MFSISHQGGGYKIKISWPGTGQRGYSIHAQDIDAIHKAIDHYYGGESSHRKGTVDNCPLCKKGK